MKKTLLLLCFGLLTLQSHARNPNMHNFKQSIGVNAKVSTGGVGADFYWNFYPRLAVRVGYETFRFNYSDTFSESQIELRADARLQTGGISTLIDYQFLSWMYVTGGVYISQFRPQIKAIPTSDISIGDGGLSLSPEIVGSLNLKIKPSSTIAPYLGLGFGRMTPRRNVSFAFEVGAYYMGAPKLEVAATGMLSPSADPSHVRMLERQLSDYKFYPVVKFSVGVKLFTFKKYK